MLKYLLTGLLGLSTFFTYSQELGSLGLLLTGKISFKDTSTAIAGLIVIVKDNSKVLLSWKAGSTACEFYTIERSVNGAAFETVAVLRQGKTELTEWQDELPVAGKDVYRIRCTLANGTQQYSASISAIIAGNIAFRFYPNPVDNVLIVRSENPVDITIIDANGKARVSQTQVSGLQLINVSALEKGIYLIRVHNRYLNTQLQERLVKN